MSSLYPRFVRQSGSDSPLPLCSGCLNMPAALLGLFPVGKQNAYTPRLPFYTGLLQKVNTNITFTGDMR